MRGTGRLVASIVAVLILIGAFVVGFATNLRPLLGLDLTGGVSVVLAGPPNTERAVMERALDRIRDRVDALGVAEPDISLLGSNLIQVQLPGLGGQGTVTRRGRQFCVEDSAGRNLGCFANRDQAQARAKAQSVQRVLQIIGTTARLEERAVEEIIQPTAPNYLTFTRGVIDPGDPLRRNRNFREVPPSPTELLTYEDTNGDGRFNPGREAKYRLGKIEITGADLSRASAQFATSASGQNVTNPGWRVVFTLNREGARKFGQATQRLVGRQLAIVLDGVVQSAPTVQSAITGGEGEITGDFTEAEAKNLAVVLSSGALPVELARQEVRTVSPLLGAESLRQGLIAGIAGLIALMLYLAFYYRVLGMVTWFGLMAWAVLALGLVALMGRTIGYALTLAGVAGLVVSIGIAADSYIVFYERLKDEVRHGKTLRTAVGPAFKRAWRTVIAGNSVTILAAAVLYVLAVGSVRGFALTLGLSTALDMFVVYFFKRPVVFLLARSPFVTSLRGMGLRSSVAADPVPVAGGER
ncbi:MAG: protein translocase subunit SecD [Actinomycetota bacterium]|nr:protein translocase subunit SecD [Actinomycetota bacterium]